MRFDAPVLLYGAGREARSTRAFLARKAPDIDVYVTVDAGPADIPGTVLLPVEERDRAIAEKRFATIVKSPGVSLYKPIIEAARTAGIAVTSNLNLWGEAYARNCQTVAITGTKGKSTTATLLHLMLAKDGRDAGLVGNVGVPPLDAADSHALLVLELSSYQTADMDFGPDYAAITNLFPEHIDWHGTTARYYADKLRLLNLDPKTRIALGPQAATHPAVLALDLNPARLVPGLTEEFEEQLRETARASRLKGTHNADNAVLAARIARDLGAGQEAILAAIAAFAPLPHRLEDHTIGEMLIVDDSISTTPEATKAALAAYFGRKIALIAGGYDRRQDYAELPATMRAAGVQLVICLPETGARLAEAIKKDAPDIAVVSAPDLDAAMDAARLRAAHFDTLILSPGAPSYNQFKDFAERGDRFVTLARTLFATTK